jgi:hypothetical protein
VIGLHSSCLSEIINPSFWNIKFLIKGPSYSLLAKEVAKFRFRTNKQSMNRGSCCVVDLEQWTGFKGVDSGCLIYCRDENLRRVKWATGAGISTKEGNGTVTVSVRSGQCEVSGFSERVYCKCLGHFVVILFFLFIN